VRPVVPDFATCPETIGRPNVRPAVFLDRDGVILEESGHPGDPDRAVMVPGAAEAVRRLHEAGLLVIVVTNQSGVARGEYPESAVDAVHRRIDELLAAEGARVDAFYYCPHHPTEGKAPYRVACDCRKPRPGMLLRAADDWGIDLSASFLIGDKLSDLEAGASVGCRTILVETGHGKGQAQELDGTPLKLLATCPSLREAVEEVLVDVVRRGI